jgi:hypothetical protein
MATVLRKGFFFTSTLTSSDDVEQQHRCQLVVNQNGHLVRDTAEKLDEGADEAWVVEGGKRS